MPQSDVYEALLKGTVQANLSPIEVLKGWNQADVTKYITKTSFLYNTLFFVTMNLDVWNSMSEDLQDIITETTEVFFEETAIGLWDRQNAAALDYAMNEKGMEIVELSDEEQDLWISRVESMQDTYDQELDELGITSDPLSLIKEMVVEYNKLYE
jgi:TRAP-type C4-dicarboxylate transport system substrate-binding protein